MDVGQHRSFEHDGLDFSSIEGIKKQSVDCRV